MRTTIALALKTTVANADPVWDASPIPVTQLQQLSYPLRPRATDPDGDALTFSVAAPLDRALIAESLRANGLDPTGAEAFSFDAETFSVIYDGRDLGIPEGGEVSIETGLRLSASDGR